MDGLKAKVAIANLEKLRGLGAMSEREFTAASNAATPLSTEMTEKQFKKTLQKLRDNIQSSLDRL